MRQRRASPRRSPPRVSPSTSVWSSADVREQHDPRAQDVGGVVTAAEPCLDDGGVDPGLGERGERGGRDRLELRRPERAPRLGARAASAASRSASSPSTVIRSAQARTCGETWRRRGGRPRAGAPRSCASRSTCRSCRRRARPRRRAAGRRARRAARACARGRSRRAATARASAASQRDVRSRAQPPSASSSRRYRSSFSRSASTTCAGAFATKLLVCEHALGARDLLAQPLELGLDVAGRLLALRAGRRPRRCGRSSSVASSTCTPLRRKIAGGLLHAVEGGRVGSEPVVRLGPGRDDQPRARGRQVRPDLLGHVRHHRVEQREQPLERGERGRRASASPS